MQTDKFRNCDRFDTLMEALKAWGIEDQGWQDWPPDEDWYDTDDILNDLFSDQLHEFIDWCFAPVTGQKGNRK